MNKKGVLLVELLISTSFIFIIIMLILNVTLYINNILSEKVQLKKINEEKAIIYREIATLFSTKNITSIVKNNNTYAISHSKSTVDENSTTSIVTGIYNVSLNGNTLSIDNQNFESNDYLKYKELKIEKVVSKTNNNYYYIRLVIGYTYLEEYYTMKMYYVNDNIESLTNINEVYYE